MAGDSAMYDPGRSRATVDGAIKQVVLLAYRRGLEHGYVQAVAAVEGRS